MIVEIDALRKAYKGETKEISALKKQHKRLRMHYYGIGKTEYLEQISGLENADQIKLRQKYARSNKDLFSNLSSPINKVFSAKGKNKTYNFKSKDTEDKFRGRLSVIDNGKSLENWLESYWKEKIAADPNGVFLIERDKEGNPYPTYKSILAIRDYKQIGQKLEYIIFEPYTKIENNTTNTYVRVYDDNADTLYLVDHDDFIVVEEETFENPWEKVPGVLISNIEDTNTKFKQSSIDNEVELADEYLLDNSVKAIYKFAHGFPLFWMYLSSCSVCKGEGEVNGSKCTTCNGSGYSLKKDVSDIIGINPPKTTDDVTITPDIAGYITPPSENLIQMTGELSLLKDMMWFSQWGTVIEKGENETATGRFIDVQPVSDRLDKYRKGLELVETLLTDFIGSYLYESAYNGCSINYGSRYMIETPDQLLDKYTQAKEKKLPQTTLSYLLNQYYQGQFASDSTRLTYYTKLMKLEPWVHMTVNEIPMLYQSTIDYEKKIYFSEWANSVTIDYIVNTDLKRLDKDLIKFINLKEKPNEPNDGQSAEKVS